MNAKSIIKKVALALAGVAALTGIGFGVKAIVDYTKEDLKTISPSFEVGNLGSDGKFVEDESTLYTKDAFPCDGLQIKLDFDNQISYQIFYYDDLDNFIESTEVLAEAYSGGVHDGFARLVIRPTNDEDDKISWTERISYPKQMEVKVNKTQDIQYCQVFNKRLRLVSNTLDLRFKYGDLVITDNNQVEFVNNDKITSTQSDLLMVKTGSTVSFIDFDKAIIGENVMQKCQCLEFNMNDGKAKLIKLNTNVAESFIVSKNTTHLLFVYSVEENSELIKVPTKILSEINSHIVISK